MVLDHEFHPFDLLVLFIVCAAPLAAAVLYILLVRAVYRLFQPKDQEYWKAKWPQRGVPQVQDYTRSYVDRYHKHRWFSPAGLGRLLATSLVGVYWLYFQVVVTIFSVVISVIELYYLEQPEWMLIANGCVTAIFTVDFVLGLYTSSDRLKYFLSWFGIVDLITILPFYAQLIYPGVTKIGTAALRPLRLLRTLRIIRRNDEVTFTAADLARRMLDTIIMVISLLFVCASIIAVIENILFHDAFYFMVVTFTTLGYGDLAPKTVTGRVVMMVIILVGFIILSWRTGKLVVLLNSRSGANGAFNTSVPGRHVLLLGEASYTSGIREFFREFFSMNEYQYRIVMLQEKPASFDMNQLLQVPFYTKNLRYLQGSEMVEQDLTRAAADTAAGCFVLANRYTPDDTRQADRETVLRCLAVRAASPRIPLLVQVVKSEYTKHLQNLGRTLLLPIEELTMGVLGRSCLAAGFSTLITNLVRTIDKALTSSLAWEAEYAAGAGHEIFSVTMSSRFHGRTGLECAKIMYEETGATLIAMRSYYVHQRAIIINPCSHIVSPGDIGYIIANDVSIAWDIMREPGLQRVRSSDKPSVPKNSTSHRSMELPDMRISDEPGFTAARRLRSVSISRSAPPPPVAEDTTFADKPRTLAECTIDRVDFSGHIVVCGPAEGLFCFMLPLRSRRLRSFRNVVVMSSKPVEDAVWLKNVGLFPQTYFMKGSPLHDLGRCNAAAAETVVLLADPERISNNFFQDASNIITMRTVNSQVPFALAELSQETTIEYLSVSDRVDDFYESAAKSTRDPWYKRTLNLARSFPNYHFNQFFACGKVFTSSMLDSLLCTAFVQPYIIELVHGLVFCGTTAEQPSCLIQVNVPTPLVGSTYGDLFRYMTGKGEVPLGLYRAAEVHSAPCRYVVTNPPPQTLLHRADRVFVLVSPTRSLLSSQADFGDDD